MHCHLRKPTSEKRARSVCKQGCFVLCLQVVNNSGLRPPVCSSGRSALVSVFQVGKPRLHRSHVDPVEFTRSSPARKQEGFDREKDWRPRWRCRGS